MRQIPIPSDAQFALNELKRAHGPKWKEKLLSCWARVQYPDLAPSSANALKRLYKSHGTTWLSKQR